MPKVFLKQGEDSFVGADRSAQYTRGIQLKIGQEILCPHDGRTKIIITTIDLSRENAEDLVRVINDTLSVI